MTCGRRACQGYGVSCRRCHRALRQGQQAAAERCARTDPGQVLPIVLLDNVLALPVTITGNGFDNPRADILACAEQVIADGPEVSLAQLTKINKMTDLMILQHLAIARIPQTPSSAMSSAGKSAKVCSAYKHEVRNASTTSPIR